ncbi:MAG: hypothetical protein M3Z35_16980 [Nitrospirota bacterium]|nr:hypothetical protein [Nitrospirota bacterium]
MKRPDEIQIRVMKDKREAAAITPVGLADGGGVPVESGRGIASAGGAAPV